MFKDLITNLGNLNISKYTSRVERINKFEEKLQQLTDRDLQQKTIEFKGRVRNGEELDSLLEEVFAVVREASSRVLGLRHFDVQMIGGMILHEGKIAEMKTGEGKTLVSLLPAYLNALEGQGVHVVTVNDYLARRDAEWVGQVHKFLGLRVGLVQSGMDVEERKENYNCDVTYITNSELGFDYLRDNMAMDTSQIVQRSLNYCIIDEVDSILIDEAKTPLIISGLGDPPTGKYAKAAILAPYLKQNIHYEMDEKGKSATLTERGIQRCEEALETNNLYDLQDPWLPFILNALKAKEFYLKDVQYITRDNEIIIVDEFTGRILPGRRWSEGLHQAVEAKEGCTVKKESVTLASITYQNFFLLYDKMSGMTGTAKTDEFELDKIYNLKVIEVPTNKTVQRKDFTDIVYRTKYGKWVATANECLEMYSKARPVLIGTTNIENSELLAELLEEYNVPYNLLNAKPENIKRESEIVAQAGRVKAVTIATNMAGRGTDILLGGNSKYFARTKLRDTFSGYIENNFITYNLTSDLEEKLILQQFIKDIDELQIEMSVDTVDSILDLACEKNKTSDELILLFRKYYEKLTDNFEKNCQAEREKVIKLGGLHIIGTERHDSRRIDDQLRGRSGRQGEPGTSRFYLSLEDELLRIFGGDRIAEATKNFNREDDIPLESSLLSSSLDTAQKKVEGFSYDARKQLYEYDEIIDSQRKSIYSERIKLLSQKNLRKKVTEYGEDILAEIFRYIDEIPTSIQKEVALEQTRQYLGLPYSLSLEELILPNLQYQMEVAYDLKESDFEGVRKGLMKEVERSFVLQQVDIKWKAHLQYMNSLKDSIGWRSYGQLNPLIEFKIGAYELFKDMITSFRYNSVYLILRSSPIF
uniref:Protein translocase subunit SecA n=1 Tax=Haptophyceae sp. NIES-3900 TaxID=2748608 RepID=A0A7R6WDU1_9EUKA|nr:preprotein-translocase subunit a [Haptophyceae sp. NIES-3900]